MQTSEVLFVVAISALILLNCLLSTIKSYDSGHCNPLLNGSRVVVDISGAVKRPKKYSAFVKTPLEEVIQRATPTLFADREFIKKYFYGKRVTKDLKIFIPKLKNIVINVVVAGACKKIELPCGSKVSDIRKMFKGKYLIEKRFLHSNRILRNGETIKFFKKSSLQ